MLYSNQQFDQLKLIIIIRKKRKLIEFDSDRISEIQEQQKTIHHLTATRNALLLKFNEA